MPVYDYRTRLVERADLGRVHALEVACFGPAGALPLLAFVQYFELFGPWFLVAERSGEIIGYAVAGRSVTDSALGWALGVAVAPGCEARGVGRALLRAQLALMAEAGVTTVLATASPGNARSRALLGGLGFASIGKHGDYFGPGQDRLLLRCDLSVRR